MNKINKTNKYNIFHYAFVFIAIMALGTLALPKSSEAFMGYIYKDASGKSFIYNYETGRTFAYQPPVAPPPVAVKDELPFSSGSQSGSAVAVAQNPTPVIYSTTPDTISSGNGNLTATVNGANFVRSSIVKWNSFDRETNYIDSNHLEVKLTSEDMAGSGEYLVTVWNPAPGGGYSNGKVFTLAGGLKSVATNTSVNSANTGNSFVANAFGAGSFMPRSIIQWLVFIILVLLGVSLWRRVYVSHEKKNAPLKHA